MAPARIRSPDTVRFARGGSVENRCRILREIVIRGLRAVGDGYPILVKINSTDGFAGEGYLTLADVVTAVRGLAEWGVNAVEVSGGHREARGVMSRPAVMAPEQEAYFAEAARALKAAVDVPVILVGGLRSLSVMEHVVATGAADLVALSRPLICEPDLVNRLRAGEAKAVCSSCNACFNPAGLRCRRPDKPQKSAEKTHLSVALTRRVPIVQAFAKKRNSG